MYLHNIRAAKFGLSFVVVILLGAGCTNVPEKPIVKEFEPINAEAPEKMEDILTESNLEYGVNRLDLAALQRKECISGGSTGPSKVEAFGKNGAKKYTFTCGDGGGYEEEVLFVSASQRPMFYYRQGNLLGGIEFQRSKDKTSYGINANYSVIEPCSGELGGFDGKIRVEEMLLNGRADLHSGNADLPFVQNGCSFFPTNFTATFEVAGKKFIINLRMPQPFVVQFGDPAAYYKASGT